MRGILILFVLCISSIMVGQSNLLPHDQIPGNIPSYKPAYQLDYPDWAKMLYQEDINYFEIEKRYVKWKKKELKSFKPIERYFKIWRRHVQPLVLEDGSINTSMGATYHNNLRIHQRESLKTSAPESANAWEFLGPKETFWLNSSGAPETPKACPWQVNIYTFDVAPSDYSTIYCGTETGFVNKSTDNGLTWQLLAQGYNFGGAVTAMEVDPQDANIVYAGAGMQVHKTIDGGSSWTPLLSSNQLFHSDKITIDPNSSNKVFSAGASGVHVSLDGGSSWTRVWNPRSYDVHFKPNDPNVIYTISKVNGLFRVAVSNDGGATFVEDNNFPSNIQDASGGLLAVTPDAPETLTAILLSSNDIPLLYRGNIRQGTWQLLATGDSNNFPMVNWQGFFDLVLEVSPLDADIIFTGTSSLFKSTNRGATFTNVGGYGGPFPIHPDIQDLQILDNGTTWVSTDGGFTFSTDNFISTDNAHARNNHLVGSDMWGFDQGWNEDIIVGGRYHNGNTAISNLYQPKALRMGGAESPTGWVMQGKSRHVAFNDLGAGWILPKTATSAPEGRFIFSKYPNMDEYGGRRGNMFFHPNYYEVIYLGEGDAFWKSSDMGTSFEMLYDFGNRIRFCQVAFSDPDVMYADIVGQGLFRSEDGGLSWTSKPNLTNGMAGNNYWRGKTHFVISPNDANTVYACLQNGTWSADIGKVFKSVDGGDTWEDWTGSLNDFTKTLLIQPDADGSDIVYLFMDNKRGNNANCYIRKSNDPDWSTFGESYPANMSPNLALPFFKESKIRVAGNGGIWETNLEEENFTPIVQPWVNRPFLDCMLDTIQLDDHSIIDHTNCTWSWDITPQPLFIDNPNTRNPKVVLGSPGTYDVTLTITKDGITYTKTIEDMVNAIECPTIDNCDNPAFLPKGIWNLEYVNSEEVNSPGLATMAFDDDPATIWHTRWSTGSDPYPHEIQIDLGDVYDIYEFTYLPRQNGQNGWIKDYELYISEDLSEWGPVADKGGFESSAAPHKIVFSSPKTGRYFKLVALSEANGNAWASAAEFDIKGCYHKISTSTGSVEKFNRLEAFPMPTQGKIEVSLPSKGDFDYSIYTITGQFIKRGKSKLDQKSIQFDITDYSNNVYVIKLTNQQGQIYFVKVIKNN